MLDAGRSVEASRIFDADVSPYCFDFDARLLLCVSTPDIAGATFFYQAQRRYARSVIEVPFDALPEAPASPTLIFSIGRCGSTLLHKAFEAAGVRTVSEPDYFTQAALHRVHDLALRDAVGRATRLLPYEVIKLRAECNSGSLLIAGAFRAPKVMFILRDPADWAASVRRVSPEPDPEALALLLRAFLLGGLDRLTRQHDVRICYYEDFRMLTARYVNALLEWIESDARLRPARAAEVARTDAQEGTALSRSAVWEPAAGESAGDRAFGEAFGREWAKVRPAALIDRLGLRRL